MLMGLAAGGKKKAAAAPPTPPTLLSATVATNGATIALVFTAPVSPMLPASGATGLTVTVAGSGAAITSTATVAATITLTMTVPIFASQVVTLAYTAGNITDSAPTALANFGATAVTNSSTRYTSTKSLVLDGVDESISVADNNLHDFSTAMTCSMWVKGASGVAPFKVLGGKSDYGGTTAWSWYLEKSNATKAAVVLSSDGTSATRKLYVTSTTIWDGTWHHFAFTFAPNVLKLYADRVLDASPTKTLDATVNSIFANSVATRFGAGRNNGTPADFFAGSFNNISLWNATLSQAQIDELATNGKPADLALHSLYATNCISWYKCGDGDTIGANGILDSTSNAIHMTPNNMESGDIVTDAP